MTDEHIDDYDDLTVDEVVAELGELDDNQLSDVLEYEQNNANRVTVTREIEAQLTTEADSGEEGGGDSSDDAETSGEDDGSGEDVGSESEGSGGDETIEVRVTQSGYHAGRWFDEPGTAEFPNNVRTRQALEEDNSLEKVE